MSYRYNTETMYCNMPEDYFINADSFGSDLPDNWQEIADAMNEEITERFNAVLNARADYESDKTDENDEKLNSAAESFLYWMDDFWDHLFWDEHPEYRE